MRHLTATLLILLLATIATACEPADQDAALKRQLEEQASQRAPRASMSFGYIHELDGVDEGGPVTVAGDTGTEIEIQEAHLVISAVEAHLCEPKVAATGAKEGRWQPIESIFIGRAHAHVPSSATRLGTPFVEDLFAAGRARIVGEISPPLGEYCRLYAIVSPADDDVLNLGDLAVDDILGRSLLLRGRWRESADAEWQPFSSASEARNVVELDAIDPNTGESPLRLDDPSESRMLLVDKTISPALFEGITPEQLQDSAAANTVLERLQEGLHIRKFEKNNSN
jgi:hypothetical protein